MAGGEVKQVEIRDITLPPELLRAMARQAEAERERRAKVISATGELEASRELARRRPSWRPRRAPSYGGMGNR